MKKPAHRAVFRLPGCLLALVCVSSLLLSVSCFQNKGHSNSFAAGDLSAPDDLPEYTVPQGLGASQDSTAAYDQNTVYQMPERTPQWELVWSDEFDYEGIPDPQRWDYDTGGHGWGNNELQYYTAGDNATVADGYLTIEARREAFEGMQYSSTRLVSRGRGDWLYGKIVVRARLPEGRGTWPAIWMLPTDWAYGDWPASGEIDIMEHVGYNPTVVHATVHTDLYNHMRSTQLGSSMRVSDAMQSFHEYSVEWFDDRIDFFIDGERYFRFSPFAGNSSPGYRQWPFDKRFHLLLNIAVGGNWGGLQGVDEDAFPAQMLIDYVRVYRDISGG